VNEADFATEQELRLAARGSQPGSQDVLADFYEEHGQLSRAALWRRSESDERTEGERDRVCVKKFARLSPIDPRRDAMIWILCLTGMPFTAVGKAFKLSVSRVREVANRIDREVYLAARAERLRTEPVARRLRTAGAVLVLPEEDDEDLGWQAREERERRERTLRIEIPPASWPYTRTHEKHRRNEECDGDNRDGSS
jgi:hypothetical protein